MTHLEKQEKEMTITDMILDALLFIMIFGSAILLLAI